MRKGTNKNIFRIAYLLFSIALILVVFIRKYINSEILTESINYFFWYTFGVMTTVMLLNRYLEDKNKTDK